MKAQTLSYQKSAALFLFLPALIAIVTANAAALFQLFVIFNAEILHVDSLNRTAATKFLLIGREEIEIWSQAKEQGKNDESNVSFQPKVCIKHSEQNLISTFY